jgi:type IV pilus biogenesis protein CpaD/CtpE
MNHTLTKYLIIASLLLAGCAARIHPGAANSFDSTTYDTLIVTHNVIESTKADLAAGKFTGTLAANVKTALNALIEAYDVADQAYLTYHSAAAAGNATPTDQATLQVKINTMTNATTTLTSAKGGM